MSGKKKEKKTIKKKNQIKHMKTSGQSPAKRGYKADRKDLRRNRVKRYNVFNMEKDKNYREQQPNLK